MDTEGGACRALNINEIKPASLDQMMRETGSNCFFAYYENDDGSYAIDFSKTAVELYRVPKSIPQAELDILLSYIVDDCRESVRAELKECLAKCAQDITIRASVLMQEQRPKLVSIDMRCTYRSNGTLRLVVGYIVDVEQMIQYNRYIQHVSMINSITLLPNRKRFEMEMKQVLGTQEKGFVILFDVIRFKLINSMYSHNIGDKTLFEIASILQRLTAHDGNIYSHMIDQFVVVLPNATQEKAQDYMERIQSYFEINLVKLDGMKMNINFAMAAIDYGETQRSFDEIMVNLDIMIQKAKTPESEGCLFFSDKERERHLRDITLERQLANSIKEGFRGFYLHYQPIIATVEGESKVIGAESLLRWCSAEGEVVPPLTIIPLLEKDSLMSKIEPWIFEQACSQCKEWLDKRKDEDFFIQINLSASQVFRGSLLDELKKAVENSGIRYQNIVLEVTESSLMINLKMAVDMLVQLKELGVRIAVDDFGTGYSSLSYLRNLPVDEIKIDRSFLKNIMNDQMARGFLSSIVDLSKSMGYTVCMEGVESDDQMMFLKNLPIDFYQGFLFSKPVNPEEFDWNP